MYDFSWDLSICVELDELIELFHEAKQTCLSERICWPIDQPFASKCRGQIYRASRLAPGEGYSPPSEHASPPSEGEKQFFRRFLAFIAPSKPYST